MAGRVGIFGVKYFSGFHIHDNGSGGGRIAADLWPLARGSL
jgi:hypothetical protein